MEMAKMMKMTSWFVDVSAWDVASPEWRQALYSLPDDEQKKVQRFVFAKDQKLALASRLLQRHLIHSQFQVPWHNIVIMRTPEGKPYWQRPSSGVAVPVAWNYNVSHHGTVVAIASHSSALVGVDVVQSSESPKRQTTASEFFRAFTDHFTAKEWRFITKSGDETAQFQAFYKLWSLKEAYIKAVGVGLGFTLLRAEFTPLDDREVDWQMRLDGEIASEWRFRSLQATSQDPMEPHLISVAIGPPSAMWKPQINSLGLPVEALTAYESVEIPHDLDWQQKTLAEIMKT